MLRDMKPKSDLKSRYNKSIKKMRNTRKQPDYTLVFAFDWIFFSDYTADDSSLYGRCPCFSFSITLYITIKYGKGYDKI